MLNKIPENINELMSKLNEKAAGDYAFKELCINEPRTAVKELFNIELHKNANISFKENNGRLELVIPDSELSDDELDRVAGGNYIKSSMDSCPNCGSELLDYPSGNTYTQYQIVCKSCGHSWLFKKLF